MSTAHTVAELIKNVASLLQISTALSAWREKCVRTLIIFATRAKGNRVVPFCGGKLGRGARLEVLCVCSADVGAPGPSSSGAAALESDACSLGCCATAASGSDGFGSGTRFGLSCGASISGKAMEEGYEVAAGAVGDSESIVPRWFRARSTRAANCRVARAAGTSTSNGGRGGRGRACCAVGGKLRV